MAAPYEDLLGRDGSFENPGGTMTKLYFAPIADFETISPPPVFGTGPTIADDVKIVPDHVMKTGKKLLEMNVILDTSQLDFEQQGERGGRSLKATYTAQYVGMLDQMFGLMRKMKNDMFIVFIVLSDGQVIQIGEEMRPAEISGGWSSAKAAEGLRAATINIETTSQSPWLYEGVLPLTEAI